MPRGEDLDLLVDDDSLAAVRDVLESGPGIQAVDLYSVCGAPGADYRKLPYYPPYLAEQLLERSVPHRDVCSVPSPRDHFLSLAYHAVYHKGTASGLPLDAQVEANRQAARARLRRDSCTRGATARHQRADHARRPRRLSRLARLAAAARHAGAARAKEQMAADARTTRAAGDPADAGLAVFLVRREALARGGVKRAAKLIAEHGFQDRRDDRVCTRTS